MKLSFLVSMALVVAVGCSKHEPYKKSDTLSMILNAKKSEPTREVQDPYVRLAAHIYPGINVYFKNPALNEIRPMFKILSVDEYPLVTVAYPNGSMEQKDRRAFQGEAYVVLKDEADRLSASY